MQWLLQLTCKLLLAPARTLSTRCVALLNAATALLIATLQPKPARSNQLQPNPDLGLVGVRLELVGFGWSGAIVGYCCNVAGWSTLGLVGAAGIFDIYGNKEASADS